MVVVAGVSMRGSTMVSRTVGALATVLLGVIVLATVVGTYVGTLGVLGVLLISVPSWSASLVSATKPVLDLPGAVMLLLLLVLLPASATSVGVL